MLVLRGRERILRCATDFDVGNGALRVLMLHSERRLLRVLRLLEDVHHCRLRVVVPNQYLFLRRLDGERQQFFYQARDVAEDPWIRHHICFSQDEGGDIGRSAVPRLFFLPIAEHLWDCDHRVVD